MAGENTARKYSYESGEARSQGNEKLSGANQLQSPGQFNVPKNGSTDNHAERLEEARKNSSGGGIKSEIESVKDIAKTAKNVAGAAAGSPVAALSLAKDALSLGKQINLMADMPFVAAFGGALLKDLLDFIAGPTIILAVLFSILCSIFIFMMLLLVNSNSKRGMASSLIKKGLVLIGGGIADSIPGIDFFPIESLTVAVIYYLTLLERKNAPKERSADNHEKNNEEMAA
ncbi:MAG: hypothetical protein ACD_8C00094G0018 [uncultured bacterium]|nr:MAG: hypothetical protein ACD_8C00094G0018 [uncultured bacterium]